MSKQTKINCDICSREYVRYKSSIKKVLLNNNGKYVCKTCYLRARNKNNTFPIGAIRYKKGYVFEKTSKGWEQQHRLVMESYLGVKLPSSLIVHHKNEIPSDNRVENLQVMTISEHRIIHNIGRKLSEQTKNKIRQAAIGRKLSKTHPFLTYWKGRKQSDLHIEKRVNSRNKTLKGKE